PYCAHAAIAEVIDVIHRADALAQFQQVLDRRVEVIGIKRALVERGCIAVLEQLDIELQPAHLREVVFPRIKKHSMKKSGCGVERRRITGAQLAVNLDQGLLWSLDRIAP